MRLIHANSLSDMSYVDFRSKPISDRLPSVFLRLRQIHPAEGIFYYNVQSVLESHSDRRRTDYVASRIRMFTPTVYAERCQS